MHAAELIRLEASCYLLQTGVVSQVEELVDAVGCGERRRWVEVVVVCPDGDESDFQTGALESTVYLGKDICQIERYA